MREIPDGKKYIDLNPKLALDYITFKKEYEGEDFLYVWNDLVEKWFDMVFLCNAVNDLRKYVRNKDMSTMNGKRDIDSKFNEIFWLRVKDRERYNKEEFRSLVGTLMHAVNKINKLTDNGKKELVDVFAEASKEKAIKKEKKQKKEERKNEQKNEAKEKEEAKLSKEWIINEELFTIFSDLESEYSNGKEVGYIINREEKEDILSDAWRIFIAKNLNIPKKELDMIYNKFYTNHIY